MGGEFSSHHLVVKDAQGGFCGILSSLDLARAMCSPNSCQSIMCRIGGIVVTEVMKPRATLPICSSTDSLAHVFVHMAAVRQNIVLISESGQSSMIIGVITPRDAVRAFAEHLRTGIKVGHYLRALQCGWAPRRVRADANLAEAAEIMASESIHHLVVISPTDAEVIGVVSSLDLAQTFPPV